MTNSPAITCTGCGECCKHMGSPPIMPDEFEALPESLRSEIDAYLGSAAYRPDGPCIWLTPHMTCREYAHRPGVCRDFPMASEPCHEYRRAVGLTVEGWPVVEDEVMDG